MPPRPRKPPPGTTVVTFPGTVRIAPVAGEKPLEQTKVKDAKGNHVGTRVLVPPGKRLDYTLNHLPAPKHGRPKKPHAVATLVDDKAAPVVHAELEHATDEKGKTTVIASSLEHPELAGAGESAHEAVTNMKAAIATKLEKKNAPEEPETVTRTAPGGELPALPEHEEEPAPPAPDLVTRHG